METGVGRRAQSNEDCDVGREGARLRSIVIRVLQLNRSVAPDALDRINLLLVPQECVVEVYQLTIIVVSEVALLEEENGK